MHTSSVEDLAVELAREHIVAVVHGDLGPPLVATVARVRHKVELGAKAVTGRRCVLVGRPNDARLLKGNQGEESGR